MGKKADLTPAKKVEIKTLLETGLFSNRQIAKQCGVGPASVDRIKKNLENSTPLLDGRTSRTNIARCTSERADRKIRQICDANRKASLGTLGHLIREAGVSVSERTVRRRLAENGMKARRPARKPRLTPAMVKARISWAKEYANFTIDDWNKVRINN